MLSTKCHYNSYIFSIHYCILTFDRAGFSSCANNVIAGHTYVNKQRHVTWMTSGIRECCSFIADMGESYSLQSGVLSLDTVSYGDWTPGAK